MREGARTGERAGGAGLVDVLARCQPSAATVLARCCEVLTVVIDHQSGDWPEAHVWKRLLPAWFVDACPPEMSTEEAEQWLAHWRSLSADEQAAAERQQAWPLADWLFWLEPAERQWHWWHGCVESQDRLRVTVEVAGWPVPLGALEWLLRAAGAVEIIVEEPVSSGG